ncbi:MAG: hypothetical protein FWB96_02750 [Defluviitaleaceae bacterium]|nr:hypothetical protein [Defluviitaleaceae bacterium]MCL2261778.1 hypothetical protein [Defluviitaleaceae bacterium]
MPEQVKKYTDPMKARWDVLTPPQRYKLLGVIAVVLLALILTAYFAFRTQWETIVSGQDMQVINPMRIVLDNAGIANRTINHGSGLQVDARHAQEAVSIINVEGAAPNSEHFTWTNALDTGLGTTDDERRRRDILGMEGAIERQLMQMQGINGAIVSLSVPTSRPFDRNAPQPTASVALTISQDFSAMQGRDLAMLVARNVARLEPDNIIIMDQFARSIWNGAEDMITDTVSSAQQMRDQYRNQAMMGLRQMFSLVFDEIDVVFQPVFDDRLLTEEVRTMFTPSEGMDGTGMMHLDTGVRATVEGGTGGIEPGLAPNAALIPGYVLPGGGEMSASNNEWHREFSLDTTTTVTQTGPGWVDPVRSRASVMAVVERHEQQALWMSDVPEGEDHRTVEDWERFKLANTTPRPINGEFYDFETMHYLAASALGIPVENVIFSIRERVITHDTDVRVWDIPTILMVAVLLLLLAMLLFGLLRRQKAADEDEESLEPQLAVEDLLVSTQLEEAREEEAAQLEEIDYYKENEVKKQIEKFVNEKPESVAALLRNWINVEEW